MKENQTKKLADLLYTTTKDWIDNTLDSNLHKNEYEVVETTVGGSVGVKYNLRDYNGSEGSIFLFTGIDGVMVRHTYTGEGIDEEMQEFDTAETYMDEFEVFGDSFRHWDLYVDDVPLGHFNIEDIMKKYEKFLSDQMDFILHGE